MGLVEGSPNRHPGQGTACRRFFFRNAMLELIWMEDPDETREHSDPRLQLRNRWAPTASPFGIILRPEAGTAIECPFPAWEYRPVTMPDLALRVADGTGLDEPMWCYMANGRAPVDAPPERRQPIDHPCGVVAITGVGLICPPLAGGSITAKMAREAVISLEPGTSHLMELEFDGGSSGSRMDLRPDLPLVLRW
jgi:hypothetical protein